MAEGKRPVYPRTTALKGLVAQYPALQGDRTVARIIEIAGEYEHGSADVEDLGVSMKRYFAVVEDLLLSLGNWVES